MATGKKLENFPVFRGDASDIDFIDYLTSEKEDFKALREGFRERKRTIGETELPYRVLSHWDDQGLLLSSSRDEPGQWRRFSYIEIAWLGVVVRLRNFGLSLPTIAAIRELTAKWDKEEGTTPLFEYYFYKAIVNDADHYLAYSPEAGAGLISARELELTTQFKGEQDILLISLKSLARAMGHDVVQSKHFQTLTDAEEELVYQTKLPHTAEVTARVEGGRIEEVLDTKNYSDATKIKEILDKMDANEEYGEVTTKIEHGKGQSISVKNRKRFK